MSLVINTNTSAMNTATLLSQSSAALSQSLQRLSSGSQITSPADDSAGLAVSMSLVAQEGENTAASNNIADAVSFNQTQDGYLSQVTSALDRMSELSVQAQDVTKSASDVSLYEQEFSTLATYVNNVATESFNGVSLFGSGTLA
ncbi:MAG TPA: flagellin, partial [Phycisphaerae bacterium]|nr:flagellin [Phycisphaerae bacterium]